MTYHRVCNKSSTTDATCETGTDYHAGAKKQQHCFVFLFTFTYVIVTGINVRVLLYLQRRKLHKLVKFVSDPFCLYE